jgi:hypothetical protein
MDSILSTLKGEYARTLLLILIPGAIALEPLAIILYKFQKLNIPQLSDYIVLVAIIYVVASIFLGFIIQDIGSRIEIQLDKCFCKKKKIEVDNFYESFEQYLFNKKEEDYIITHYYRSMLIRLRFELHTSASIVILLLGSLIRIFIEKDFKIDCKSSIWFIVICFFVLGYLLFEAKEGVELLYKLRSKINKKFKPSISGS